jgi:hypothetical protein
MGKLFFVTFSGRVHLSSRRMNTPICRQNRLDKAGEALLECFPRSSSRLEHMAQSVVTLVALWERVEEIVPHNPYRFCGDDWEPNHPNACTLEIYRK